MYASDSSDDPVDEEIICAECDGSGEDPRTDQACLTCNGTGLVPAFEKEEQ